jgi:hypothetical protein
MEEDILYQLTMQDVLAHLQHRIGEEALSLSPEELELLREEVKAALEHHLDSRDLIAIGLDSWEIVRNL